MYDPIQFGARISRLRRSLGLSERELALRCGNGFSTLSLKSLEAGRKDSLTVLQLMTLAFHLGVTPAELLVGVSQLGEKITVIPGDDPVIASRKDAYTWFSGLKSAQALEMKSNSGNVKVPDQSRTPEVVRLYERQTFLVAELERHRKLEQYQPGRINSIMIRALESEIADVKKLLSVLSA